MQTNTDFTKSILHGPKKRLMQDLSIDMQNDRRITLQLINVYIKSNKTFEVNFGRNLYDTRNEWYDCCKIILWSGCIWFSFIFNEISLMHRLYTLNHVEILDAVYLHR